MPSLLLFIIFGMATLEKNIHPSAIVEPKDNAMAQSTCGLALGTPPQPCLPVVTAQPQPQPNSTSTRVGVDKVISWPTPHHTTPHLNF